MNTKYCLVRYNFFSIVTITNKVLVFSYDVGNVKYEDVAQQRRLFFSSKTFK